MQKIKLVYKYINQIIRRFLGEYSNCHVLSFHRVVDEHDLNNLGIRDYELSKERFEEIITIYLKNNYRFVTMDELLKLKQKNEIDKHVAFTFDDGYVDTYFNVLPIIEKYKIPITIFFVERYLNNSIVKWDYALAELLNRSNNHVELLNFFSINLDLVPSKNKIYDVLRKELKSKNNKISYKQIESFFIEFLPDYKYIIKKYMLNTQQLKKMASHNLVNIGSHSSSHFVMTDLEEIDQENEILNSKKFIEEIIVKPVNHFCYPYGEFNEKSKEILIKNGYKSAVTTVPRNIFKTKKEDFFCIPRYVVKCGDKNKKFLSLM